MDMDITFDLRKDALNIEKHRVSLAEAAKLDWDTLQEKPDTRQDYGEERFIGYGFINNRLYCVIFTDRGDKRRIISLRKANPREIKNYGKRIL